MTDTYQDREQTKAKHFLLRSYLQALAFKILRFSDLTYVDGFSGPWKTATENFSDSSFMIALSALRDAQQTVFEQTKIRRKVRCFFSESDSDAFSKLRDAVSVHNRPDRGFEVKTFRGEFESAVSEIQGFVGNSFALIFIDPTGWTGYSFEKIKPLFAPRNCEVLINFMYAFVNRFIETNDQDIVASLDPILGGPGWQSRLDKALPRSEAVVRLFRNSLKTAGKFEFVVATKIDKPAEDRPYFFMAYGTKKYAGLKAFRDTEHKVLRAHAANRVGAKARKQESKSGQKDFLADHEAKVRAESVEEIVAADMQSARPAILEMLREVSHLEFSKIAGPLMERYMLRETNVKDLIVELAREGALENTWGGGNRKPQENDIIETKSRA